MHFSARNLQPWAGGLALGLLLSTTARGQTNLLDVIEPSAPADGSLFGSSVALDGEMAAISTFRTIDPQSSGAIDLYRVSASGTWEFESRIDSPLWDPQQMLPASTPSGFGSGLALDGDTLLVGNRFPALLDESTEAYVYRRDPLTSTWNAEATLRYPGVNPFPLFGPAVDIEGDTAVVAAPFGNFGADPNGVARGVLYVFERAGSSWTLSDSLTLQPSSLALRLGRTVEIVGQRIVSLTERLDATPGGVPVVAVFARDAGGGWNQEALLPVPDATGPFEESVAYDGRTLVVEIPQGIQSMQLTTDPRIVCYRRDGTTWTRLPDILATAPQDFPSDAVGQEVGLGRALTGDLAVRGNRVYYGYGASRVGEYGGTIEVHEFNGVSWQRLGFLHPPGLQEGDGLGTAIAVSDGRLLASALGKEDALAGDLALNTGAAYVFRIDDPSLTSFCEAPVGACAPCPCGNDAAAGAATGCVNSSGVGARLVGSGNPLPQADSLQFDLEGAAPSSFAFLAVGNTPLPNLGGVCPPGSGVTGALLDGKRCIGGGLLRLGLRAVDAQGNVGVTTAPWGGGNAPAGGLIAASGGTFGSTLYFQAFYRDNGAGSCGAGVNTTNGVQAILLP